MAAACGPVLVPDPVVPSGGDMGMAFPYDEECTATGNPSRLGVLRACSTASASTRCGDCGLLSTVGAQGHEGSSHSGSWYCVACWLAWHGLAEKVEDEGGHAGGWPQSLDPGPPSPPHEPPPPHESPLRRTEHQRRHQWASICSALDAVDASRVEVTVAVFDDRDASSAPHLALNCELNGRQCGSQGHEFCLAGGPGWPDLDRMPPHWARVFHLRSLAAARPSDPHRFLISLDSDAVLSNPRFPLARLLAALPAERSVFAAKDPHMWPPPEGWEASGVYCSGFVAVRLDDRGRDFLARWCDSYDPMKWWQREDRRWTTDGNWAGPTYEQGQLNLLAQGELADRAFELPQALFNSPYARPAGGPQPVVLHLMRRPGEPAGGVGAKDERVAATFRRLLEVADDGDGQEPPRTGGAGPRGDDGIPRSVAELRRWEEDEEDWWTSAWVERLLWPG